MRFFLACLLLAQILDPRALSAADRWLVGHPGPPELGRLVKRWRTEHHTESSKMTLVFAAQYDKGRFVEEVDLAEADGDWEVVGFRRAPAPPAP